MSKIEKRKSAAATLVELLQSVLSYVPENGEFDVDELLHLSADAMSSANRHLMDADDIGAAITSIIFHTCKMELVEDEAENWKAFDACRKFGEYFCKLMDSRPEEFAPHARQWSLLRHTILFLWQNEVATVSGLANKAVEAGINKNFDTARALIKADITAGRLKAKKVGNQYQIEASDAAEWLANPARGSRSEAE